MSRITKSFFDENFLEVKECEVEEIGTFSVREMSGSTFERYLKITEDKNKSPIDYVAWLIAFTLVDEEGNYLFSPDTKSIEQIKKLGFNKLNKMAKEITKQLGLDEKSQKEQMEEIEKN